ncbi:hypothetical protein NQ317_008303 [Molorchus minor]|uniref:Macro domain-containing protein n=1 Tax=Molorchus minor TaxID=1323400 RepID=A0ABQ9J1D3_9CUCU|nr:hypothetical protein NQ317_008303 [Molorchus minor]
MKVEKNTFLLTTDPPRVSRDEVNCRIQTKTLGCDAGTRIITRFLICVSTVDGVRPVQVEIHGCCSTPGELGDAPATVLVETLKTTGAVYYVEDLQNEIRERTQGLEENVLLYIISMEALHSRLPFPPPEADIIRQIRRNLNPFFADKLVLETTDLLRDLKNKCRAIQDLTTFNTKYHPPPGKDGLLEPDLACLSLDPEHPRKPVKAYAVSQTKPVSSTCWNYDNSVKESMFLTVLRVQKRGGGCRASDRGKTINSVTPRDARFSPIEDSSEPVSINSIYAITAAQPKFPSSISLHNPRQIFRRQESRKEKLNDQNFSNNNSANVAMIKSVPTAMNLLEVECDLFTVPKDVSLAHCVSADMHMGAGIAVKFRDNFRCVQALLQQQQHTGGLAILQFEYRLSLLRLREHVIEKGVRKLAIPTLGCGRDKLSRSTVRTMMISCFEDVDIEILVCHVSGFDVPKVTIAEPEVNKVTKVTFAEPEVPLTSLIKNDPCLEINIPDVPLSRTEPRHANDRLNGTFMPTAEGWNSWLQHVHGANQPALVNSIQQRSALNPEQQKSLEEIIERFQDLVSDKLGFVVDQLGLRTSPDKVSDIEDFKPPTTTTEIKRLIDLVSYYRRFIKDFSTVAAPITSLLHGRKKAEIAQALRLAKHEVTQLPPSYLVFGRHIPVSGDFYSSDVEPNNFNVKNNLFWAKEMRFLPELYDEVKERLHKAYETNAKQYNLRKRPLTFSLGDIVWKKNYCLSDGTKYFSKKLLVACKVTKVVSPLIYELSDLDNVSLAAELKLRFNSGQVVMHWYVFEPGLGFAAGDAAISV